MLPVRMQYLLHRLLRNGKHWCPVLFRDFRTGWLDACATWLDAEKGRKFVAGVYVSDAIQVADQVNQIAAFVTRGKVTPSAFSQVDL
ncbi:hypothetical protein D3C78_608220 [compost metagenome]